MAAPHKDTLDERQRAKDIFMPVLLGNNDKDTINKAWMAFQLGWSLAQTASTYGAPWKSSW